MTFRQNFKCLSCEKVIAVRIQLGYRKVEKIAFGCPGCARPLGMELHLDPDKGRILGFQQHKGVKEVGDGDADFVKNHSPDFAQSIGKEDVDGISAFIEAFHRGGGGEEFLLKVKRQQLVVEIAANHSDTIRQLIDTYRQKKWSHYERLASDYLENGESIEDPITHESLLLRAMEHYLGPLILSSAHVNTIKQIHEWISVVVDANREGFAEFIVELAELGYLDQAWSDGLDLYLRIFDAIEHFRQMLAEWDPERPDDVESDDTTITSTPSFDNLKALYVDGYEFLARVLTFAVGLENIEFRGAHDNFRQHKRYKDFKPKSLTEFQNKANAPKLDYLESALATKIASSLEAALRNGLGHYSARFDSTSGVVKYRLGKNGPEAELPYGSFLLRLIRMAMRIQEAMYSIKFLRTYEKGRPWEKVISYGVNELGLPIATGSEITDREPCESCGHTLLEHTGSEGVLSEFAFFIDCDSCACEKFEHSAELYSLDELVEESRLR